MNRISTIAAATIVTLGTLAGTATTASAGGWVDHREAVVAGGVGLLGGLIIGNALSSGPVYAAPPPVYTPVVSAGEAHVAWCSGKYRSYNAYDNTWIDRQGRLRVCQSPYWR